MLRTITTLAAGAALMLAAVLGAAALTDTADAGWECPTTVDGLRGWYEVPEGAICSDGSTPNHVIVVGTVTAPPLPTPGDPSAAPTAEPTPAPVPSYECSAVDGCDLSITFTSPDGDVVKIVQIRLVDTPPETP